MVQKWLFIAEPKNWKWETLKDKEDSWRSHKDSGRKKRVRNSEPLSQIEEGTIVIGYASHSIKSVYAIAIVTRKPYREGKELRIPIRKAFYNYILDKPVTLDNLRRELPHSIFTYSGNKINLTYAKLLDEEYVGIRKLIINNNPYLKTKIEGLEKGTYKYLKKVLQSEEDDDLYKDLSIDVTPDKAKRVVEVYRRNRKLIQELKGDYKNKCQICKDTFKKRGGGCYSEAHHLIPLGEKGYDRKDNIVILCPTCHKKLHYAKGVEIGNKRGNKRKVVINTKQDNIKY